MLRTHCQTSGVSLTEQDPYNNVVRTTIEAMAAVLGGTQSLHTNSFDEALGPAHRLLGPHRPQHPADHPGGDRHPRRSSTRWAASYYVEALTHALADRAWAIIEEVEALGGMTKAVDSGMPKLRIEEAAARRQARVDRGEEVIVGVNKYRADDPDHVDVLDIDNTKVREQQVARLEQVRAEPRRRRRATQPSSALREGAAGDGNLLALCIDAARARATVGEMSDAMEEVFGRHQAEIRSISGVYGAAYEGDDDFDARRGPRWRPSPRPRAAGPASSSPRWARTATTGAPRWSAPPSPTSASTSTSARCSRRPRRWPGPPSRTTSTSSACRARPPATRPSCPQLIDELARRAATTSSWCAAA